MLVCMRGGVRPRAAAARAASRFRDGLRATTAKPLRCCGVGQGLVLFGPVVETWRRFR